MSKTYTLENYLVGLHTGAWFGWSDSKNKVYANLVIHSSDAKPSEADCNAGVAALQADWDGKAYARNRVAEYPSIADQLDDIYHNGIDAWKATIKTTKDKYPKP
tara:strand:- start:116 stop:427 length:312 start_codon:yes stop_codon:yes gene_type:complete